MEEENDVDILDEVKKIDRVKRRQLLLTEFEKVKQLAKQVIESKEKCKMILEEVGLKEEDIKKVIDFVNSMDEVKLSDSKRENLRDTVKIGIKVRRDEIAEKMQRPIVHDGWSTSNPMQFKTFTGDFLDPNITLCSDSGTGIEVRF